MRSGRSAVRSSRRQGRAGLHRGVAQGVIVSLVVGLLAVLAIRHDGSPINDVELNSGGVWVSNQDLQMMARLNSQSKELEMGILTSATSDVIFQQGASVQTLDPGGGNGEQTLRVADPVTGSAEGIDVPGSFDVSVGGGVVGLVDRESGRVWIRRVDQLPGFTTDSPHDFTISPRSGVVVSRDGTALVADRRSGVVTEYRLDVSGTPVEQDTIDFETEFTDDAEFSAVGDVPVALQEGKLLRPGADPVAVSGQDPVLQAVGPASPTVWVASDEGLWRTDLSGGDLIQESVVEAGGAPAPPVNVAGCVHAAWAAPGEDNYQRTCADGDAPFVAEIEPLGATADLVFRANRDVVVINDVATGSAWLVEQNGLTQVDNWPSVNPNARDPQVAEASDEKADTKRNKPPQAVDDEFGARPGTTVVLPVTLNDIDPDGDILTLTQPPASNEQASFSVTGGGTQVQAQLAPDVEGSLSFKYEISDGRPENPPSEATVTLKIFDDEVDKKPVLIEGQDNELVVAAGHEASLNVLPAWIDPEGDSLALVDANSDGGDVGFRPDGTIDFLDKGGSEGRKKIDFVVQGGEATAKGTVAVTVVDPEKAQPQAVADRFSGQVGSSILLEPLANDTDPLGGQMTVPRLQVVAGGAAKVSEDPDRGTVTFQADRHGTYYLEYEAASANGQASDTALIRVDVVPRTAKNRPPVATRDVAAVQSDGSVLVDVLANDVDPDGDVMVVQGIEIPPKWQDSVTASLIDKRFVRVEVSGDLKDADTNPSFEYLLSDGRSEQVSGEVSVVLADTLENRPPVAREDVVTVRAGTLVTIPVLDNDEDPDGDSLSVYQQDLFDVDSHTDWVGEGEVPIVATGEGIRVMVPDDGTTQMQIGYGVRDREQARADARLVLNITPDDPETNRPPEPRPIEDRTVSGQRIRVPVDIFGADPDGDPVVYTGLVEPPRFGRIVKSGAGWFEYEPFKGEKNTGTDTFKIRVSDPYGASGIAEVRIGVAPRSPVNQAPAALDDHLLVKPGLTVQYPVTANDSDPDGDPLILEEDRFSAPDGVEARVVDQFVEMEVPELRDQSEVNKGAFYSITDGLGTSSSALFTVTAREDAPDHAPLASDDVVTSEQMAGKTAGDTVTVDVLANDGDLDGSVDELQLEAVGKGAQVDGRKLQVTLRPEGRTVPYKVTDKTDQYSFGFVYVAGTEKMPPQLNTAAVPVEAIAGEDTAISLADVVIVRDGRTPKVARTDRITSSNGDTTSDGLEDLTFRAPPAYHGPASVTLDVIDGEDLNDPTGLSSQITIPITVLPSGNLPPQVRSTSVVVRAGGQARTVDLDRLATDVNEDELSFDVKGARDGVEVDIEDNVLAVSADKSAPSGQVDLEVSASDGSADPQSGQVTVTVIGLPEDDEGEDEVDTVAPPMELTPLRIADAEAGEPVTVDVSDAVAFDPFPGKSKKVTFASATGPAGDTSTSGSNIIVTPTGAGKVVVTYRLDDGSGEPSREAEGRVVIVVADVPAAPPPPTAVEGGPDSVQLTWRAPDDQGSPIQHYLVRRAGSDDSTRCVATQCTIQGLDAGKEYRFTVTAVNGLGEGEPSPPSSPVTPDTVPGTMVAPVVQGDDLTNRDGKLRLSWGTASNEGSDITKYELQSSPSSSVRSVGPEQQEMVWDGLANGTSYRFRVRAVNDRGPGVWSPWSDTQTPFTKPNQMPPPSLSAAGNDDGDGDGYLEVSWPTPQSPADGHDDVTGFEVRVYRGGGKEPVAAKPVTGNSTSFTVPNGHSYTAVVRGTNRAGKSGWSGRSGAVTTWDRASKPTSISKADDCVKCLESKSSYRGKVQFTTPSDNGGYPVTEYRYKTSDGTTGTWTGLDRGEGVRVTATLPFNSKGQGQSVTITPVTNPEGQGSTSGASSAGGTFNPYAKPYFRSTSKNAGYRDAVFSYVCEGNGRAIKSFVATRSDTGTQKRPDCNNGSAVVHWGNPDPIQGGSRIGTKATFTTTAGAKASHDSGSVRVDDPTINASVHKRSATGDCKDPCYRVQISLDGLVAKDNPYTVSGVGTGGGCPGPFDRPKGLRVGSDGRVTDSRTWVITGKYCSGTKLTVKYDINYPGGGGTRTFSDSVKVP